VRCRQRKTNPLRLTRRFGLPPRRSLSAAKGRILPAVKESGPSLRSGSDVEEARSRARSTNEATETALALSGMRFRLFVQRRTKPTRADGVRGYKRSQRAERGAQAFA
jgi:hypothetical protein